MPRVLPDFKKYRIVIWTNDHLPPHVHVFAPDAEARFRILCAAEKQGIELWDSFGYSLADLREVGVYLVENVVRLCHAWRSIHGNF